MSEQITTTYVPIYVLQRSVHRGNPKKHDDAGIRASMLRFGFTAPVGIDQYGTVVAGHGRIEAAQALCLEGHPAPRGVVVDASGSWCLPTVTWYFATEAERDAYVIADNRLTEAGGWDDDALRTLLAAHGKANLESIGFSASDYNRAMSGFAIRERGDADRTPDPPTASDAITKPGDVWQLGDHVLVCGDSVHDDAIDRALAFVAKGDVELADLAFSDPPYNREVLSGGRMFSKKERRKRGGAAAIANDALGDDFAPFLEASARQIVDHVVPGGAIYISMSTREWPLIDATLRAAGGKWSSTIIWKKSKHVPMPTNGGDYHCAYEPIWYGWREGAPRRRPGNSREWNDLWEIASVATHLKRHPTQKPVELAARALRHTSHHGDLVLDPFAGSGSTLIAAERTGRRAALVELDPVWCDVIVERWQGETGGQAVRPSGG